jgi:hypothetical protein
MDVFLLLSQNFSRFKKEFELTLQKAEQAGFKITNGPKLPFSHSAILN